MGSLLVNYPISSRVASFRMKELSESAPDSALYSLAKALDLPIDDAETVDFVRQALMVAHVEIRTQYLSEEIDSMKEKQP